MIELAISLLAVPVFWAFAEWRLGLLLCLATAILQDPLRKLTPDQPVYFVAFAGVVFAAACLGAWTRGVSLTPNVVFGRHRQFATLFSLLLLLFVVQAFNSYLRFGNPMLPLIGFLTYVLPFPSIVFAYQLVLREGEHRIHQFMKWYTVCVILALITVYLEFSGYDWPVLGGLGPNLLIYNRGPGGGVLIPHSGIFRASEIAAWHAMGCACFVLLLATLRKINLQVLLTAAIVVALVMAIGLLTGRRKLVITFVVFASTYLILWVILQKGVAKLGIALAIAGAVGFGWLVGQLGVLDHVDEESLGYSLYVERSKTVYQEIPSRVMELGIAPVMWAYESFGPLGAGLGVGTQGTQYFGGGGEVAGAAEGGLGKITLELGIPGLLVVGGIAILLFRHLWRIMRAASRVSPRIARLSFGLFSFLVANMAAFSVATQAFGDLFILLILSWTLGFLLAVPILLEREVRARQPAILEELAPVFRPKPV